MTFGKNLKNLRLLHHLTQDELAKATGINRSNLAMYEKDNRCPQVEKLKLLAQYFNVDMNTLLADGSPASQSGEVAPSAGGVPISSEDARILARIRRLTPDGRAKIESYTDYILAEETAAREERNKKAASSDATAM